MDTSTKPSWALWYARIFGVVLTLIGVFGLFLTTSQSNVESLMGFDVNLTHNIVHLATGLLGLAAGWGGMLAARTYAIVLGVVYTLVGIWGFMDSDPLGLFGNINQADNVLHLVIGIAGIAAYAMSKSDSDEVVV